MNTKQALAKTKGCVIRDKDWRALAKEAYEMSQKRKIYAEKEKKLLEQLKVASGFKSSAYGEFMFVSTERLGTLNYSLIPEIKDLDKSYLDEFRKESTLSWQLKKI